MYGPITLSGRNSAAYPTAGRIPVGGYWRRKGCS